MASAWTCSASCGGGSTTQAGHTWKHEYLLHGPLGTGKTSLITVITNLLKFNIYDLEIITVQSNTKEWRSGIAVMVVFAAGASLTSDSGEGST
jgi:hypothetical protein